MPATITNIDGECPPLGPRGLRLDAAHRWFVRGTAEEREQIACALAPGTCERLPELLVLQFGNAVGIHRVPGIGPVDVYTGKFGEEDFESMLGEITEALTALPFAAGTAAELPYDRCLADDAAVLYHAFAYLRHACGETSRHDERLPQAIGLVLAQPHRRLERQSRAVPLGQVRRLDAGAIVRSIAGGGQLQRVPASRLPLATALGGHLPVTLDDSRPEARIDVPENRFVKAFLGQAVAIVERMRALALGHSSAFFRACVLADCDRMLRVLAPLARHAMWREVGAMTRPPFESTVLQRRRGYRDVLRHFVRLRLVSKLRLDATSLLEVKDIARLYEMWGFFAVQEEVTRVLGLAPDRAQRAVIDDLQARVPWGLRITWGDRAELFYNVSFSRSSRERSSYSLPLRPDILLRVRKGPNAGDHVLDPKFRLRRLADVVPEGDVEDGDERAEHGGRFKYADLYKMHTYRDALEGVESVWILYPGDEYRYFEAPQGGARERRPLSGVGAVPLVPKSSRAQLTTLVRTLLDR